MLHICLYTKYTICSEKFWKGACRLIKLKRLRDGVGENNNEVLLYIYNMFDTYPLFLTSNKLNTSFKSLISRGVSALVIRSGIGALGLG